MESVGKENGKANGNTSAVPQDDEVHEEIDDSEYPGPLRLTAILVSLVFSIFLVSIALPQCFQTKAHS